jgi:hypothetical protein
MANSPKFASKFVRLNSLLHTTFNTIAYHSKSNNFVSEQFSGFADLWTARSPLLFGCPTCYILCLCVFPSYKTMHKQQQKRGVKNFFCHTFLCGHKFHKIQNYSSFEVLKKKLWANFQRIIEHFTQKIVTKLSKIWLWDPGSEIRDPEKTYSGSSGQKGTGSRIRICNTDLL